jgi:integrase
MAKASRKRDYIFQRPGSSNWYVKLRSPGEKRKEVSLGTSDRAQAEIIALPMIVEHKKRLLAARPRLERTWQCKLEPGREHTAPDGGRILATDKELFYIGHDGSITWTEPNGGEAFVIVGNGALSARDEFAAFDAAYAGLIGEGVIDRQRPKVPAKTADDAILEIYLKDKNVTGYSEREARAVWALFRSLCDKPLKDCSRDDGRLLVAHYQAEGLKAASIRRKLMWLNAVVNMAINDRKDGDPLKLKFNPFASIVPNPKPGEPGASERRFPLDDDDIAECKAKLNALDDAGQPLLSDADQLLFRVLATTGMRRSEAFQIDGEKTERDVRYVMVGSKTEQSERRVPLPADLLPYLPKTIKGKLFTGRTDTASKRLNQFLRDCGIADKRKVLHSLRHRAQDRLRAFECPQDIRWALLGHEEKSVAEGYGKGFSVPQLKKWIDKIGF